MWETQVWFPGWEDPLEKGMATHSSIPACKIPWTEDPDQLKVELRSGLWGGGSSPLLSWPPRCLWAPHSFSPPWLLLSYLWEHCEKPNLKPFLQAMGMPPEAVTAAVLLWVMGFPAQLLLVNILPDSFCIFSPPILQELRAALWPGPCWRAKSMWWERWLETWPNQRRRCSGTSGLRWFKGTWMTKHRWRLPWREPMGPSW